MTVKEEAHLPDLNRPGPQPHNAGITPGYRSDGQPIQEADSLTERLRVAELAVDKMRDWAVKVQKRLLDQEAAIRTLTEDVRRLESLLAAPEPAEAKQPATTNGQVKK